MSKLTGFVLASMLFLSAGADAVRADHQFPAVTAGPMVARHDSATLVVTVPQDARVYLEDRLMRSTGAVRRFVSPRLEPGVTHVYTVRVEVDRDGKVVSETIKARVRAGDRVEVTARFAEDRPDQLTMNVNPATRGRETYRSFSFEPSQPGAAAVQAPVYGTAPMTAPMMRRAARAPDRIEQRLRPGREWGSWRR